MGRESLSESDRLFARLVVEQGLVTSEQLEVCLGLRDGLIERGANPPPKIGELLLRRGFLTPDKYAATLHASLSPPTTRAPSAPQPLPPEAEAAGRNPANAVGRYVLVSRLGAGGMGEVWRAWDRDLRRWVALKFLKGENPAELARFEREAQTAAALSHPNISAVYDVGHHETRAYIALQLVNGRTLAAFPRRDRKLLARLMHDAALAVQYAHDEGVVHRDLKPHNLMVEGTDPATLRVYVMDFGLAKQTAGGSSLSASGSVLGTPAYMPPEQAHGRLRDVDSRSDIYSLGATLYELLADEPPFSDSNVLEILRKVVEEDPRPLRKVNPLIDGDLETIVMKCLEKERDRRYATARGLAEDLDRWLRGEAIQAHPPSVAYRLRKFVARRKAIVIPIAAAVLCAAGFGAWALSANTRREEEKAAKTAALTDKASQDRAMKLLEAGRPAIDQASRYLYDRNADYQELVRRVDLGQKQIEQALEIAPGLASAHFLLGRAWELKGWEEKAEACWRKAIELDPEFGAPRFHLGRLLLERTVTTMLYSEGESRADQLARMPE